MYELREFPPFGAPAFAVAPFAASDFWPAGAGTPFGCRWTVPASIDVTAWLPAECWRASRPNRRGSLDRVDDRAVGHLGSTVRFAFRLCGRYIRTRHRAIVASSGGWLNP